MRFIRTDMRFYSANMRFYAICVPVVLVLWVGLLSLDNHNQEDIWGSIKEWEHLVEVSLHSLLVCSQESVIQLVGNCNKIISVSLW